MFAPFFVLLIGGALAADPSVPAKPAKVLVGPTGAMALPLVLGKPVGVAVGVQAIVPVERARLAAEVFTATPVTAFAPAVGGDVAVGLVDHNGVGGAVALYARGTLGVGDVVPSAQIGPGAILLAKIAPTVVFAVPLVVWVDVESASVTPTLTLKTVFGIPYGR